MPSARSRYRAWMTFARSRTRRDSCRDINGCPSTWARFRCVVSLSRARRGIRALVRVIVRDRETRARTVTTERRTGTIHHQFSRRSVTAGTKWTTNDSTTRATRARPTSGSRDGVSSERCRERVGGRDGRRAVIEDRRMTDGGRRRRNAAGAHQLGGRALGDDDTVGIHDSGVVVRT